MVKLHGIRKSFGDLNVLKGVDLDVNKGEVVAILGPSGSGKTTFLRTINFLDPANEGTVEIDGLEVDFSTASKKDIIALRKKQQWFFKITIYLKIKPLWKM